MPDLFPRIRTDEITVEQKVDELRREIKTRRRVYPRWVAQGKLKPDVADLRIKILVAMVRDYEKTDPRRSDGHQKEAHQKGATP